MLSRPQRWLPIVLFAGISLALAGGWAFTIHADAQDARERDELLAEQTALRVSDWVNSRLALLRALRSVAQSGELNAAWGVRVRHAVEQIGGFQAINWVDAHGVITRLAPTDGNEAALGRNLLDHSVVGDTVRASMNDFEDRLSPPIDLYQGGRGFTAYVPARAEADGRLLGLVNGVFRADQLAADCLDGLSPHHAVRLTDAGEALVTSPNFAQLSDQSRAIAWVHLGDRTWKLEVRSSHESAPLAVATLVFGACILLSAALAWLLDIALARQRQVALAHAERARIEARLRAAERLEAMGHLAGGVAHDFNNLLTVIIGHTDLLRANLDAGGRDRADLDESVAAIQDASIRAAAVTSQLLAFSRREPVTHGTVDAVAHLRDVAPMLRHLATEAVTVAVDLPPGPLWTACPAAVLDRVLVNLVANARDATDGHGTVRIRVRPDGEHVRITVSDDGRGMPKDVLAHVFEPFFTTRANGSGLGLATVYGLVHQRGGTVDVSSVEGEGTTFVIQLPACDPADGPSPVAAPTSTTRHGGAAPAIRVLFVEDNDAVRATVRRGLKNAGFDVAAYEDGESALTHDGPVDLLVSDLVLPGIDGATVASRLLERTPDLRVIIVSGYSDQPGSVDALIARGARFLAKPFEVRDLVALARSLMGRERGPTTAPRVRGDATVDTLSEEV